jgi:hypothetical protein
VEEKKKAILVFASGDERLAPTGMNLGQVMHDDHGYTTTGIMC